LIGTTKIVNDVGYWLARLWIALVVRELAILGHAAVFISPACGSEVHAYEYTVYYLPNKAICL
jgi:hypothetical protein